MAEVKLDPQVVAAKTYLRGCAAELGLTAEFERYVQEMENMLAEVKSTGERETAAFCLAQQYFSLGMEEKV